MAVMIDLLLAFIEKNDERDGSISRNLPVFHEVIIAFQLFVCHTQTKGVKLSVHDF